MARWAGEMEFEFVEGEQGGAFVATAKVVQFLRTHLARGEVAEATRLFEDSGNDKVAAELLEEASSASSKTQRALAEMFTAARDFANAARVLGMSRDYNAAA